MKPTSTSPVKSHLEHVAVVLLRPKLSENIGTAARAATNMGLGRLILVDPPVFEKEVVQHAATRAARPIVDNIIRFETLPQALSGFHYVVGTTARGGAHRGPFITPRALAQKLAAPGENNRVALVFGPERTGLATADLRLCQAVVRIPTADPGTSSLNLAQAVLILGYELMLAKKTGDPRPPRIKSAPVSEVQAMYDHLSRTLRTIGFLPDLNSDHWLMSFKRIFNRSGLTHGECNLIRGLCRQIAWAVNHPDKVRRVEDPERDA